MNQEYWNYSTALLKQILEEEKAFVDCAERGFFLPGQADNAANKRIQLILTILDSRDELEAEV